MSHLHAQPPRAPPGRRPWTSPEHDAKPLLTLWVVGAFLALIQQSAVGLVGRVALAVACVLAAVTTYVVALETVRRLRTASRRHVERAARPRSDVRPGGDRPAAPSRPARPRASVSRA